MMRVVDIFAGCGGLSLGFQQVGYEIVGAIDNWQPAIRVYRQNFSHPIFNVDLSQDTSIVVELKPDVIIGGPPCQDFSSAGKRNETLGRADMTYVFANIISQTRPQFFIMENVDRIIKTKTLAIIKSQLCDIGYGLSEITLLASLCGVPQDRKRYFLIGEYQGRHQAILPYLNQNLAPKPMTVYEYLGDSIDTEHYYRHPRNYSRRAIFSIYEPSPTIRGVNRPIPKNYQLHPNDTCQQLAHVRPLTSQERASIQTFPKEFVFEGTKSDVEQMIGNAVPAKLAEYVANAVMRYHQAKHEGIPDIQQMPMQLSLL
jgi:DNA (cytosine-5)-methyltransferase 1